MSEPRDPEPAPETPRERRRPGRVRRWVVRPFIWGLLLLAVLLVAALFFLQSRFAQERATALVIARVSELLGRRLEVGELDYTFFPPAVEMRDVVLPGPRPGDPPVVRVPFVRAQISAQDLRERVIKIEQVEVFEPQVYLQFNPDGTNNLPKFRTRKGGTRRFDFQIGRILVQNGTLRLNEERLPLTLEAKAVWGRLIGKAERGGEGGNRLDALVTAQEVVTTLPRARPYPFTASAKGSIRPAEGRVEIAAARITGPDLSARARGFVAYRAAERRIELAIDAQGQAALANRLGYVEEPIEGAVDFDGRFDLAGSDWAWSGTATSPRIAVLNRVFQEIEADLAGNRERVDADLRRVGYVGGTVQGDVGITTGGDRGEGGVPVALDLTYEGLSIQPLIRDQFPGEELPIVSGISGRAAGTLAYRFTTGDVLGGSGRADVRVRGTSETGLPISGTIPLDLEEGVISSRDVRLTAPAQDILGREVVYDLQRKTGHVSFQLVSRDVGPLSPLLTGPPKRGEEPAFWLPTEGRGTADGEAVFSGDDYSLRIALDLQDAVAPALAADTVKGSFTLNRRAVDDLRLEATNDGGALMLTGRVPLPPEGRTAAAEPLALAVDAAQWPVSGLRYFLPAAVTNEVQGMVSGRLDLAGFPDRLSGRADAQVQELAIAGNRIGRVRADVGFDSGRITIERALVETPAGSVLGRGSFDQATEAFDVTVDAPSLSLAAEPFRGWLNGELTGQVTVAASGTGTLARPQVTASVRGSDLALRGRPLGQGGETSVLATWSGERVDVRGSLLGLASFEGGGRLDQEGADVAIDLRTDNLGVLARLASPQPLPEFTGSLLGTLGLTADFSAGSWQADLRLADLRAQYQGHTIANLEPVVVEMTPERVRVRSLYLGEAASGTELFVSGTLGLAEGVPLDLQFQGTVPAVWAELALPEWQVQGSLDLLGSVRGTLDNPLLNGQGAVSGGEVIVPGFAQSFENIEAFLSFNRDRILLEHLQGRLGGGTLEANGTLTLPGENRQVSYRLNLFAKNVSVPFPEGFLSRGNAEISLASTEAGRQIVGQVDLQRMLYVEDVALELLPLVQRALQRERIEVAETNELLSGTELNLIVRGPDSLRVRNNVANLEGDIDLTVRGTLARPVAFGEVELDQGGTLVFNDTEYEVERGLLTFSNPNRIDPVIDLVADSRIQGFDITLNLGGTFERPDVNFSSDANLADLEIVSLITTGQRPDDTTLTDLTGEGEQVAAGVVARQFLYGQATSALSKRVGTLFGFDRFRIDPLTEAGQPITGVGVTVGKRLSSDVFVTYTSDPTSNRQYVVQVEWQVERNLLLVFTQEGDGSYAVDARWERRF